MIRDPGETTRRGTALGRRPDRREPPQGRTSYFVVLVVLEAAWRGRTLGKALLRVRVVTDAGEMTWRAALIHNLLRPIDALPFLYLLGFIVLLTNKDRRRIGDLLARTRVIALRRADDTTVAGHSER